MQSVLDRCQTAIQSQNVQLVAQGNEITRLSQSVDEVKNVGLLTVQNNTRISAGLPNPTALNTPNNMGFKLDPVRSIILKRLNVQGLAFVLHVGKVVITLETTDSLMAIGRMMTVCQPTSHVVLQLTFQVLVCI